MFSYDHIRELPGWLAEDEAECLYDLVKRARKGNVLELGSFCGKSTCVLAQAVKDRDSGTVVAMDRFDHNVPFKHNYRDPNEQEKKIGSTYAQFWKNLRDKKLASYVLAIKADHEVSQAIVEGMFSVAFIDGGHTINRVLADGIYAWSRLIEGGYIAFHDYEHDFFTDVKKGVQALSSVWGEPIIERHGSIVVIKK